MVHSEHETLLSLARQLGMYFGLENTREYGGQGKASACVGKDSVMLSSMIV